jgi:hypothetical protein
MPNKDVHVATQGDKRRYGGDTCASTVTSSMKSNSEYV